jgi:hypothetical protein
MKFKRFTKIQFLKQIGRGLLDQLFARFAAELTTRKVSMPATTLPDEEYFAALAGVVLAPEGLPERLVEALCAIEDLATAEGQERLELGLAHAGLKLEFPDTATHGDIAVQVFLAHPALLAEKHNESRLCRLSAFEYFGGGSRTGRSGEKQKVEIGKADILTKERMEALAVELDEWFKAHQRGHETTRIEFHELDGELWFLVRHGDTFTRRTKVEARRWEIMHFRPAKDDVVVYAPKRNEIRVHAGTKGEKELYRRAFGRLLTGNGEHFGERKGYTLEPLREDCADALNPRGLPGVRQIVLREVELAWGRKKHEFMVRGGVDIHGSARARGREAIPDYGTIVRAVLDFHFVDEGRPRRVEVRTPNTVKMARGCDARTVHEWLSARGFRSACRTGHQENLSGANREAVAA